MPLFFLAGLARGTVGSWSRFTGYFSPFKAAYDPPTMQDDLRAHPNAEPAQDAFHRQVQRIMCGYHHRPVVAAVAHAIASIAPNVADQVELDLIG